MKHKTAGEMLVWAGWIVLTGVSARAADWPWWRGPAHNGISAETDWNPKALSDTTKPLWTASVGTGFSAVSVAEGKAVTLGNVDKTTDVVTCLDALTGKELWTWRYEEPLTPNLYEGGPNATPTIQEKRVYTISKSGKLFCLDLEKGTLIWRRQLDFAKPEWGFAGSPLIVGGKVIYNVGSGGLALDKETGEVLWESTKEASGYATPVPFDFDGKKLLALFSKEHLFAVEAADGKVLWSFPWKTSWDVNASDPVVGGSEILITSGYNRGIAMLKITADGFQPVWENKNMRSQLSGPVLIDGYLYGIDDVQLACLEWKTGQVRWTERPVGKGSLTAAGDKLIVLSETGKLTIAQATPDRFAELSSAKILSGRCWTIPILSHGLIYARNAKGELVCIDMRNKQSGASLLDSPPVITAAEMSSGPSPKEWSCWQGPDRNNKSPETGLLKRWQPEGPDLLWWAGNLGDGYSSPMIAGRKVYVTGMEKKRGLLTCLDWEGQLVWTADYGPEWTGSYPGVRTSPVIHEGGVYVITGQGKVGCFGAETGRQRWMVDPFTEFEGKMPRWGVSMSPVLVKDKLIYTVGGKKATLVALDAKKGHVLWASESIGDGSAYCTPTVFQWAGRTLIAGMTDSHLFAADAETGQLFWQYAIGDYLAGRNQRIHPVTPAYYDGALLFTSGYDMGAVKFSLTKDGLALQKEWTNPEFDCHHGSVVCHDGYVYGSSWKGNDDGLWMCVDWKTGETLYAQRWYNKGSLIWADGLFYAYAEKDGVLGLVNADPKEFYVISEFPVTLGDGEHWAHPVLSGKRLFLRHGDTLMAYDLKS